MCSMGYGDRKEPLSSCLSTVRICFYGPSSFGPKKVVRLPASLEHAKQGCTHILDLGAHIRTKKGVNVNNYPPL